MANVNLTMIDRLRERAPVSAFGVMSGRHRGVRGHLVKAGRAFLAIFGIARCRTGGARTFYGSVDDGIGGLYTAAFAATARIAGMAIYLHHHSFRYIDRATLTMRLLTVAAGPKAHHVVLCECMGGKLAQRYRRITRIVVAPNSLVAPAIAQSSSDRREKGVVQLGMLSNLTFEKGLATFIELLEAAHAAGLPVHGVLAGPFGDARSAAFYREAHARLGDLLSWRGGLYGEEKDAFFASLDVFVFPTRYAAEAYPLVVLEALLRGRPVISWDRGCLGEFAPLESCTIVPRGDEFTPAALDVLRSYVAQPDLLAARKAAAAGEGMALNEANSQATQALVDRLVGAGS